MYSLPCHMYVIAGAVAAAGSSISHTTAPLALSNARKIFPPPYGGPPPGSVLNPSPMNTSDFVTVGPTRPGLPSGGRFRPFNNGWLRGPSPFGTLHLISPLFRSIATRRPYGGFTIGNPSRAATRPP